MGWSQPSARSRNLGSRPWPASFLLTLAPRSSGLTRTLNHGRRRICASRLHLVRVRAPARAARRRSRAAALRPTWRRLLPGCQNVRPTCTRNASGSVLTEFRRVRKLPGLDLRPRRRRRPQPVLVRHVSSSAACVSAQAHTSNPRSETATPDWKPRWNWRPSDALLSYEWFPGATSLSPPFFAFAAAVKDHPIHLLDGSDQRVCWVPLRSRRATS